MSEICKKCGLPKELCVCDALKKEEKRIRISQVNRRFGKMITVVEGIGKDVDTRHILTELKMGLACGGTLKDGVIELQGAHKGRVAPILVKLGFPKEQIEVD
jgi:translation initiation factor 1